MKKTQTSLNYVVVSIILLMVLYFLVQFVYEANSKLQESIDAKQCKDEVFYHSLQHVKGIDLSSPIQGCFREDYVSSAKNKQEAMYALSKKQWECADMWHFGKREVFSKNYRNAMINYYHQLSGGTSSTDNFCVQCHKISFDSGKIEFDARDLLLYQTYHTYPQTQETFASMLLGTHTDPERLAHVIESGLSQQQIGTFSTNNEFITLFRFKKADYVTQTAGAAIGIGVGFITAIILVPFTAGASLIPASALIVGVGTAGGLTGYQLGESKSGDWTADVLLLPYEKEILENLDCTQLPVKLVEKDGS